MDSTAQPRNDWTLLIRPRDPLILRDARPFTADPGARAFSLDWSLPSTIAGALRTHIGSLSNVNWENWRQERNGRSQEHPLQRVEILAGLRADRLPGEDSWRVGVPAPADALAYKDPNGKLEITRLRPDPLGADEGCNLPDIDGEQLLPIQIESPNKPDSAGTFWSLQATVRWLLGETMLPDASDRWPALLDDTRVHVRVARETLTAAQGYLFSTTGLAFGPALRRPSTNGQDPSEQHPETAILCRIRAPEALSWQPDRAFIPIGGERRQARLDPTPSLQVNPWDIPEDLALKLAGRTRFRLQLVTPAIFREGWRPGWLTPRRPNEVPAPLAGLGVRLRAMVTGRRIAISGWDATHRCEKPLRYAVPAGSVLFFETSRPLTLDEARRLWLLPISDGARNRRDGFGLALPGVWEDQW